MSSSNTSSSAPANDQTASSSGPRLARIRGPNRALAKSLSRGSSNTSDSRSEDDDIIILSDDSARRVQLPHARKDCQSHAFVSGEKDPSNKHCCEKCFCFVCDKPANDCDDWEEHCHVTDDVSGKHLRLCHKNRLYATLVGLILQRAPSNALPVREEEKQLFKTRANSVDKIDRGFRLYEAGTVEAAGQTEGLKHEFSFVARYYMKEFEKTRVANELQTTQNFQKMMILDAISETIMKRTWRPPEFASPDAQWDEEAEQLYDRICLGIGSRWITMWAVTWGFLEVRDCFWERFEAYRLSTKHELCFERAFGVVAVLCKEDHPSLSNNLLALFLPLHNRWKRHAIVNPDTHRSREIMEEILLKDSFLKTALQYTVSEDAVKNSAEYEKIEREMAWFVFLRELESCETPKRLQELIRMNSDEKDFFLLLRKLSDICMFSQRRFSFFSDGFKCVKRVMVIRFHLFVCMFESVEAKFVSMLDEEKLRNPQMHIRFKEFFEKIFTTLAKLFEFLAMERSKDPECLEQSPLAICTAVQALFSSASKFPYSVFMASQIRKLSAPMQNYFLHVEREMNSIESALFKPCQEALRRIYDDPECLLFRDVLTSFPNGGDIYRLSSFKRRLRRRLQ